jgi:[protein-PII] uridylyltransferase
MTSSAPAELLKRTPASAPYSEPPAYIALREAWKRERNLAIEVFRQGQDPERLLRSLSRAADRVLRALWRMLSPSRQYALVAVGGYGRGELFPHSDVDLLILTPGRPEGEASARLERFVGACWDIGLEIGHSVRTVEDCLRESAADITVQTSLLERRRLAGSRSRFDELGSRYAEMLGAHAFFSAKLLEMRQRHAKYDDSPYSLEPNTKESPGGLRDLQVVRWIARASGFGHNWHELHQRGLVDASEASQLRANERRLARVRAWLHVLAGRREDRLVFDLQARAAEALGLARADARRSSEELMQRYYRAAKTVTQLNTIVLQNLRSALFPSAAGAPPEPIDAEFVNRQGLLDIADDDLFEREPSAILRSFQTMQRHSELSGMTTRTLRALWHARTRIDSRFRRDPVNRALFLELLQAPRGVTHELRRMNKWSVLGRYLPVFRRIVGRMQHDLFHVYTVDQHILMVVRNLRRFAIPEHAHEYPFCSQLLAGFDKPWLLTVAALFHDIAKGRGGDHSALGRHDARRFCRQHGLANDETALVEFLVEQHLTMSSVAQKQDLGDPEVITRFARLVGSEERLVALYLLTVADIRGTSPKVWNAWKARLLEDLFRATKRVLDGETPTRERRLDARRAEAVRLLNLHAVAPLRYEQFWNELGVAYFLRNDAQDIAWHARVLPGRSDNRPVVRTRLAPIGEGFQVVVWLQDQPDLFARICGYFDSKNLSVLDAKIHTTRSGFALDSFLVVDPLGSTGQYRDILALVETELSEWLAHRIELPPPVRGRSSRRSRHFPIEPSVDLRPDERGEHFLLSFTANDRTGLLYSIARVLGKHGIGLQTARITTLGERVEDVLLIEGDALLDARRQLQFETDLLAALRA